jgi:hypothetical protein
MATIEQWIPSHLNTYLRCKTRHDKVHAIESEYWSLVKASLKETHPSEMVRAIVSIIHISLRAGKYRLVRFSIHYAKREGFHYPLRTYLVKYLSCYNTCSHHQRAVTSLAEFGGRRIRRSLIALCARSEDIPNVLMLHHDYATPMPPLITSINTGNIALCELIYQNLIRQHKTPVTKLPCSQQCKICYYSARLSINRNNIPFTRLSISALMSENLPMLKWLYLRTDINYEIGLTYHISMVTNPAIVKWLVDNFYPITQHTLKLMLL